MYGSCSDEMGFIRGYSGLFIETKLRLNCVAINRCKTVKTINFLLRTNWVHPRTQAIYEFGVFSSGNVSPTQTELDKVIDCPYSLTREKLFFQPWRCTDQALLGEGY